METGIAGARSVWMRVKGGQERPREEEAKGKGEREGKSGFDTLPLVTHYSLSYHEKAGAFFSCTIAVPPSFSKHLAISPRKEAWHSMQPSDMTREVVGRNQMWTKASVRGQP